MNGSQAGMVDVQQTGVLTPVRVQEGMPLREDRQDSAFGVGSQASASLPSTALPSVERAARTDSAASSLPSPKPELGQDLASQISGEMKVLSDKEMGLPAPARLQEIWEAMGVGDAVGVG